MTELEKQLLRQVQQLTIQNQKQAEQIQELIQQLTTMNRRLFGTSSEKTSEDQLSLFDEVPFEQAEPTEEKAADCEQITYQRKKRTGHKAFLTTDLPVQVIEHTLPLDQQVCSCCHHPLNHLGRKEARTELEFIPAHLVKHIHYEHAYECLSCKKQGTNRIYTKKAPQAALQKSLAGPSLLAWNLYQKLEMSLPYHRQEREWQRYGLSVSRRTLANWSIRACEDWLEPLYQRMKNHLLQEEVLAADETVYQILHRQDKKPATSDARIWLFRTAETAKHPIILYHASETRRFEVAETFLRGFNGYLHCDGYQVYQKLTDVQLQTCWAHVRRKFLETNDPYGKGAVGVSYCNQLFALEKKWKRCEPEERLRHRLKQSKPLMEEFWTWLDSLILMKGPLQKAVHYTLKLKTSLQAFLTDGRLMISNNLAERSIRPVTIGRKNWVFSTSPAGAKANAIGYSLIQTAKENGLEPYSYLTWLFEKLPQADIFRHPKQLDTFLPWHSAAQQAVGRFKKE